MIYANWDSRGRMGGGRGNVLSISHGNWLDDRGVRFMLGSIIVINKFDIELKTKYYWIFY